jgi:hypothetical protein
MKIKTSVKAGSLTTINHHQTPAVGVKKSGHKRR